MCCQIINKIFLLLIFLNCILGLYVPVYMWSRRQVLKPSPALKKISQTRFKNILSEFLTEEMSHLVAFFEPRLSPEDFYQNKDLSDLKNQQIFLNYIPNVEKPFEAISECRQLSEKRVFMINLNNTKNNILSIYLSMLEKKTNLLAIFTGYEPSWSPSLVPTFPKSRHLLESASTESESITFKADQILLYLTSSGIYIRNKSHAKIKIDKSYGFTSQIAKNGTQMTAVLKNQDIEIFFDIIRKNTYWYVASIVVQEEHDLMMIIQTNEHIKHLHNSSIKGTEEFYAPIGFSFHCGIFNLTAKDQDVRLILPGFQIQAFLKNHTFGPAYDCVYFMTITIWSVLFVCFTYLGILCIGLIMIANIKPLIRLDDPKSKPLTIVVDD